MTLTRRELGLLLAGSASGVSAPKSIVFPAERWEFRPPESAGADVSLLDQLASGLGGRGCVVKDGYVIKSWGSQSEIGDWLSSSKPVLSTLLFFAIQEGKLQSVDSRIQDFGWNLEPKDREMKFAHLANMISGYARPEPPGAAWAYNDFAIQLYQQTLFDRVFKQDPREAAMQPDRLGGLHLEDGLEFKASNRRMSASVRDFARIAWFWLQKGNWQGKQLLARAFFDRYQRPSVKAGLPRTAKADTRDYLGIGTYGGGSDHFTGYGPGIYGFNWWFNRPARYRSRQVTWPGAPKDTFMSIGAGGNCTVIIPSLNVVLAAARANWGQVEPGNPEWLTNRYIGLLAGAMGAKR